MVAAVTGVIADAEGEATLAKADMPLHLITLCVGFIIAYGLLQMVEWFRRRRKRRAEEDAAFAAKTADSATERRESAEHRL